MAWGIIEFCGKNISFTNFMIGHMQKVNKFLSFLDLYFVSSCSGLPPRRVVQPDAVFN